MRQVPTVPHYRDTIMVQRGRRSRSSKYIYVPMPAVAFAFRQGASSGGNVDEGVQGRSVEAAWFARIRILLRNKAELHCL
jgi:hypothetical protein